MMSAARPGDQMGANFQFPRHRCRTSTLRPARQTLVMLHHHYQASTTQAVLRRPPSMPCHTLPMKPLPRHIPPQLVQTVHCSPCRMARTQPCSRSCWHRHSVRQMTRRSCSRAGSRMRCGRGQSQHGQPPHRVSTPLQSACTASLCIRAAGTYTWPCAC